MAVLQWDSGKLMMVFGRSLNVLQIFSNTHPLLYMFVASLNNNFALMCNMYEAKIHLPNTGGAFFHNDMNWFHYYQAYIAGQNVDANQSPQMVLFLTDTVPGKCDFFISNELYQQANWVKTMEVTQSAYIYICYLFSFLFCRNCTLYTLTNTRVTRQ